MSRYCPTCKSKLYESDNFFCAQCGNFLSAGTVKNPENRVTSYWQDDTDEVHEKINLVTAFSKLARISMAKKLTGLIVGIVFVTSFTYGYLKLSGQDSSLFNIVWSFYKSTEQSTLEVKPIISKPPVKEVKTGILPNEFLSGVLFSEDLLKYVPAEAEVVVEVSDAPRFLELLSEFDGGYKKLSTELASKTGKKAVYFLLDVEGKKSFEFVIELKSSSYDVPVELKQELSWLTIDKVGKYLVIASDLEVLEKSYNAAAKLEKDITKNSGFVLEKPKSSTAAKAFVYTSDSGKAYLTTIGRGQSQLGGLLAKYLSENVSLFVVN